MIPTKRLTQDEFEAFGPIQPANPNDPNCFEGYFDVEDVAGKPANTVWTVVEDEDENLLAVPGLRYVNAIGYLLTEQPWTDDIADALWHDASDMD